MNVYCLRGFSMMEDRGVNKYGLTAATHNLLVIMKVSVIIPSAGLGTRMGRHRTREGWHQPQAVYAAE